MRIPSIAKKFEDKIRIPIKNKKNNESNTIFMITPKIVLVIANVTISITSGSATFVIALPAVPNFCPINI